MLHAGFERMVISSPQLAASTSFAGPPEPVAQPLSAYRLEPDLAAACKAGRQQSEHMRLGLHLVVLGHVDAGKSTLMGRLLYELG